VVWKGEEGKGRGGGGVLFPSLRVRSSTGGSVDWGPHGGGSVESLAGPEPVNQRSGKRSWDAFTWARLRWGVKNAGVGATAVWGRCLGVIRSARRSDEARLRDGMIFIDGIKTLIG
jgi:hypothetical protein